MDDGWQLRVSGSARILKDNEGCHINILGRMLHLRLSPSPFLRSSLSLALAFSATIRSFRRRRLELNDLREEFVTSNQRGGKDGGQLDRDLVLTRGWLTLQRDWYQRWLHRHICLVTTPNEISEVVENVNYNNLFINFKKFLQLILKFNNYVYWNRDMFLDFVSFR